MAEVKPRISVEYAGTATVVTFTDEKILEDKDINALQESIISVVDQAEGIILILDFSSVKFLQSCTACIRRRCIQCIP